MGASCGKAQQHGKTHFSPPAPLVLGLPLGLPLTRQSDSGRREVWLDNAQGGAAVLGVR